MAIDDLTHMLDEVNAAITAILTRGQAVEFKGQTYTRANLADLRQLRRELRKEVAQTRRGGIRSRRFVALD